MDYRHSGSVSNKKKRSNSTLSAQSSSTDLNESVAGQYEAAILGADMTCCICMEDFAKLDPDDLENSMADTEVVVLPCKAHFFHEECIGEWIKKQNACPICREDITLTRLKH